ncbi:MAG: PAS domain S-box protein [Bacteroidales bacterium]|nr:PAS domain S-box protein [Bacteroidales bacterium]
MWKNILLQKKHPARWITTIYVVFGVFWIMFSDTIVAWLLTDAASLTRVQTFKGWAFVLGSGTLIYFIVSWMIRDLRKAKLSEAENRKLQRDFFNRHFQPMWQTDAFGYGIFFNRKWTEFTGFLPPKDKPLGWIDIVHLDDKPFCIENFSKGLISKEAFTLEFRIMDKHNEYKWVFNSCAPQFDREGNFTGFIGFLFDIQDKKQLEERYKNSSRRYSYLFDNNPHPMLVYDLQDLRLVEVNKAALMQYGYSMEEMLNLTLTELRPVSEIPSFMEHMAGPMPDYQRSSGWLHKRKDGSVFHAEIIAHRLPVMNNRRTRLVIIMDITEQVEVFRVAKDGERRFNRIFDHSPYATLILDDKLRLKQINASACEILGADPGNPPFYQLLDIVAQNSMDNIISEIDKLSQNKPVLGEANFLRLNGDVFRVQYHAVSFQETGKLKYYFSFNDIDEKHKMQLTLEESERINATLVSNLPGMAYRCRNDKYWTMLFISMGVEKLTGYKPSELIHNNLVAFEEIIHANDREKIREIVKHALYVRNKCEIQYRIITKSGKIKWVWEQAHGVFNFNGDMMYIEGFIMDITERVKAEELVNKQVEELRRINEELERFSYTVSHDLRSPLVTIKGFMGLLREDIRDGNLHETEESMMRIENATDKMQQLLEDLLQLSRVGRIVNPYESFSMTSAAMEAKELLFGLISEKKCEINIQENMPLVFADRSRTRELYQNLIENAIKFSRPNEKPKIQVYSTERDGKTVFCVSDNGIGIPRQYQEKIFGLFNKLDNNSQGTGVGLSLVKHIVENHKGTIWVESDGNNTGTLFCFTLNTEN